MINVKDFKKALSEILPIISKDSPRNYGQVAYFDKTHIVVTDGFRLTRVEISGLPEIPFSLNKANLTVLKAFLVAYDPVEIDLNLSQDQTTVEVSARLGSLKMRTSAVRYPNYQHVLPTEFKGSTPLDGKSKAKEIKETLDPKCKAKFYDLSQVSAGIPDIIVNGSFLHQALKGSNSAVLKWGDTQDSITVNYSNVQHVIVPIRSQDND